MRQRTAAHTTIRRTRTRRAATGLTTAVWPATPRRPPKQTGVSPGPAAAGIGSRALPAAGIGSKGPWRPLDLTLGSAGPLAAPMEHVAEQVRPVRDDSIHAELQETVHLGGIV